MTYTDDELVAMTQQYEETHDGAYIAHLAYIEINNQVRLGRPWSKCSNCGNPYPVEVMADMCSEECLNQYVDYLNEETRGSHL